MPKFNVGDTVIGNSPDRYAVTRKGWVGVVVDPNSSRLVKTHFPYHPENGDIVVVGKDGFEFIVDEVYFDLHGSETQIDVDNFLDLIFEPDD